MLSTGKWLAWGAEGSAEGGEGSLGEGLVKGWAHNWQPCSASAMAMPELPLQTRWAMQLDHVSTIILGGCWSLSTNGHEEHQIRVSNKSKYRKDVWGSGMSGSPESSGGPEVMRFWKKGSEQKPVYSGCCGGFIQ